MLAKRGEIWGRIFIEMGVEEGNFFGDSVGEGREEEEKRTGGE